MQMESLSWCLGQLGPVRPLGSTLRFPDGEEWYAFGLTTNRWYRQMFLLIAMPQTLSGEPVVLVFYGDHLPYLGDNQKGYAELESEVSIPENEREDILCSYKTPYVLWANDAAADTLNWSEAVAALDLPEDGVLSASFLGSVLLDLTGRAGESPWFDFLSSLRRIAPVVQKKTYILADGSVLPQRILNEQTDEASMELKDAVRKWRCWSYYKLKYADVG